MSIILLYNYILKYFYIRNKNKSKKKRKIGSKKKVEAVEVRPNVIFEKRYI